jgi:aarF domain-containing kinase
MLPVRLNIDANQCITGNNQFLGSPVNRIRLTGYWASRALIEDKSLGLGTRWRNRWSHLKFTFVLLLTDVAWWVARVRQWLGRGEGMEDEMEKQLRNIAKDTFGVELQHSVFEG